MVSFIASFGERKSLGRFHLDNETFCWVQNFNLLPMLCWIGIVSNATIKYGCVIKYVFVYIGTMISCIYFQRVVAVLMKGVDEGNEECPSSSTSRKMLKMT